MFCQYRASTSVITKEVVSSATDAPIRLTIAVVQESSSSSMSDVCSHVNAIIGNTTKVEEAVERVNHFHNQGGALHAMMSYQDVNMEHMFANYNLTFDRRGSGNLIYGTEVHGFIKRYISSQASPRGGYFSALPGHFLNQSSANTNHIDFHENKIKTVQEPNSEERWIVGMGPVGPTCDNLLQLGSGYEAKVCA